MSTNNGLQGSAKTLTAQQRNIDALKARTENPDLTWQQIANRFGYASRGAAHREVMTLHRRNQQNASDEFRANWDAELETALDEAKIIARGTYDARENIEDALMEGGEVSVIIAAAVDAMKRDSKLRLEAIDRIVKIGERLAKMHGYDAVIKVENTGTAGFNIVIPAALAPESGALPDDITSG